MMGDSRPKCVIIGAGATGCGVGRDMALRGFDVTLIEFDDLGSGTSSRFHGMLQSGARYAVSDTDYAAECYRERLNIARLLPSSVEQTGGVFVSLPDDPADYADKFVAGCQGAKIDVAELDPERFMAEEPAVTRNVLRVFSVPDATIQPWRLVNHLADEIRHYKGKVLTRHRVNAIDVQGGAVKGVRVSGPEGEHFLPADVVVNSAGPWCRRVAAMVGEDTDLELGKGSILVFAHRLTTRVVNRCRPPNSHDIIVPTGTISLFGTTSETVQDPDTTHVRPEEIQELLDGAEPLIPNARSYRGLRAWAGVRPLYKPATRDPSKPLPRRHSVIEHAENGVAGFFTICGGSLSTHRSMAEDIGNRICRSLGLDQPCRTSATPFVGVPMADWQPARNYYRAETARRQSDQICECEQVDRQDVVTLIEDRGIRRLNDIRRRLRVGFGPCQGTFCASRVAAEIARVDPAYDVEADLAAFWMERLKGSRYTAWGAQAKQALLSDLVYRESLGLRLTPGILPKDAMR